MITTYKKEFCPGIVLLKLKIPKLVLKTVVDNYGFNFKLKTGVVNYGFNFRN